MTATNGELVRAENPDIAITGTLEHLAGEAVIAGAAIGDDGVATFEYQGTTRVWWDEQRTQRAADGKGIFIDENGDEVSQDQVALRLPDGRIVRPVSLREG